jgi:hypothetical protein
VLRSVKFFATKYTGVTNVQVRNFTFAVTDSGSETGTTLVPAVILVAGALF